MNTDVQDSPISDFLGYLEMELLDSTAASLLVFGGNMVMFSTAVCHFLHRDE